MKVLSTCCGFIVFLSNLSAQVVDSLDQKRIEAFVRSNVYVQPEVVDKETTAKVFYGTFFKAEVKISYIPTESSTYSESGINIHNDSVTKIRSCCSNQEFPALLSLVKKDFLLNNEESAQLFENALNVLYPVKKKEIPNVRHLQEGTKWLFIRGTFFDDLQAFIVTTDTNGRIKNIAYELPYIEN